MKRNYYYLVILGYAGDSAECVTIVKAKNLVELSEKGFKRTKSQEPIRFQSCKCAELWAHKYLPGYPKHRMNYCI